jgi:hypothetical protein
MSTHQDFSDGDDWAPDETALLASLPAERIPPNELKARTTDSMRARGLLRPPARSSRRPIALLAAACVIFIAGAAVGYVAATRANKQADDPRVASRQAVAQADTTAFKTQPVRHIVWY